MNFTGAELALESATQTAPGTVQVRFTTDPLVANPAGIHDALNPSLWTVTGPGVVVVQAAGTVPSDPQSVNLFLTANLPPGQWFVSVSGQVQTFDGHVMTSPATVPLLAAHFGVQMSVAGGGVNLSAADVLRKHLNPVLKGPAWDALLAALGAGDQVNVDNARSAAAQLHRSAASGKYLDQRAADDGQQRPADVGMPDPLFRRLLVKTTATQQTQQVLLDALEVFYGSEALRAYAQTSLAGPFFLTDGDQLLVTIDGRTTYTLTFTAAEFAQIGIAGAIEVASSITRQFRLLGSTAYAAPFTDPVGGAQRVRIYSGAGGLASSVQVLGGRAQNYLQFPQLLPAYGAGGLPTWIITADPSTGRTRYSTTAAPASVDLTQVVPGDYVTVYGPSFDAANRGTYQVANVSVTYPLGNPAQYFEVQNVPGFAQSVTPLAQNELLFFRPVRSAPSGGVVVSQGAGSTTIVLPATSRAVGRGRYQAAYLNVAPSVAITGLTRALGGPVTVTAPAHGLSQGQWAIVDGAWGSPNSPSVTAGDLGTLSLPLVMNFSRTPTADESPRSLWMGLGVDPAGARRWHTCTALQDGRALYVGGERYDVGLSLPLLMNQVGNPTVLATCGLFRVISSNLGPGGTAMTFEFEAATSLVQAREHHRSLLLTDATEGGKVLVTGGYTGSAYLTDCVLYTAAPPAGAGSWSGAGALGLARAGHAISMRTDSKPVVCGGTSNGTSSTRSVEYFDPSANSWNMAPSMNAARLQPGLVTYVPPVAGGASGNTAVVCGGRQIDGATSHLNFAKPTDMGTILATAETYTETSGAWTYTGSMSCARFGHALVLLPSGRVLALGGWGYPLNQPATAPVRLASCEVWDPNTGQWSPAGAMSSGRAFMDADLLTMPDGTKKLYVAGGNPTSTAVDVLDPATMTWGTSAATMPAPREQAASAVLAAGSTWFNCGGVDATGFTTAVDGMLVAGAERVVAGGLNGLVKVATVPDAGTFTYSTPDRPEYTALAAGAAATVTPFKAPAASIPGPYAYDTKSAGGWTKVATTLSTGVAKGRQYAQLQVASAASFPDAPGWLMLDLGGPAMTLPVPYLARLSPTSLALDFSYSFPATVPVGATVTLLAGKGPWLPAAPEQAGSFYLTASPAGRVGASAAVDALVAAGYAVKKLILYPGDSGLGAAGYPVAGAQKLSDAVAVWAGNDVDAEVAAAKVS